MFNKKKKYLRECPKCHKTYRIGHDGIEDGCDSCLGIERDRTRDHAVWMPGETTKKYVHLSGGSTVLTREQAFNNPPF